MQMHVAALRFHEQCTSGCNLHATIMLSSRNLTLDAMV
eukprot:COSAG02_NODE_24901_length_675_cov_1.382609_1_plen_37_part_10